MPDGAEAEAVVPPADRVGEVIADRYRILSHLGEGGMGAVYVAEHTLMRKRVALKLLHPEMASNEEVVARFRREAEAVAHLDHPHVVAATDFGQTRDGSFFLVLELVDGVSLGKAMRGGPFPAVRALWIARQVALALERAHASGIVHRDLKPENVMLVQKEDDPDFVKVLDFGVARFEPDRGGATRQALTRAGTVMGTPEYMAPEQAIGERVTSSADLYALGVVMYEMLTRRLPFEGDAMTLLSLQIVAPVPSMADRAPELTIAPEIEALVRRLLEKDPAARFASATDLITAIDETAVAAGFEWRAPVRSSARLSVPNPAALERSSVVVRSSVAGAATVVPGKHTPAGLAATVAAMPAPVTAAPAPAVAPPFLEQARTRVAPLVATIRRQADQLLSSLQAATKLPRATLVASIAVATGCLFIGALTTIALLSHKRVSGVGTLVSAPAAEASPEAVRTAAAKGPAALELLATQYPRDRAVLRELAFSYDARERVEDALAVVERIAKEGADPVPPELVRIVVRATAKTDGFDPAFRLLEGTLGAAGVDALVEIAERKDLPERARSRASASLKKEQVRARATPAAAFLIDLDAATTCEARLSVLTKSGSDADGRALARLSALKSTRGCGRGGRYDCHGCLRGDDTLERTMRAAERRDGR